MQAPQPAPGSGVALSLSDGWALDPPYPPGPVFFTSTPNVAFVLLLAASLALLARRRGAPIAERLRRATPALLPIPAALSAASVVLLARSEPPGGAAPYVIAWEAAIAALLALPILHWPARAAHPATSGRVPLLLALLLALGARLLWLTSIPPRIQTEEVSMGLWYRFPMEGRVPELFGAGYVKLPMLHFALRGVLATLLGEGLAGMRLTTVVVSMATVALTAALAALLLDEGDGAGGRLAGCAAALFLAFHHAFLFWSRAGYHHIDGALAMVATLVPLVRGLRSGSWPLGLLAGCVSGILVQGYFSARVVPVVALATYAALALRPSSRTLAVRSAAAFVAAFLIAAAPQILVYAREPGSLTVREEKGATITLHAPIGRAAAGKLLDAVVETAAGHTIRGSDDVNYGAPAPYLHLLWRPLVLLGAAVLVVRRRKLALLVIATSLLGTLFLGAVLVQPSRERRTFPALPALALLAGAAVGEAARRARGAAGLEGRLPLIVVGLLLGAGAADQAHLVLVRQPRLKPCDLPSAAARYAAASDGPVQILASPALSAGDPHLELIARGAEIRFVARPEQLEAGPVMWSAWHAALLDDVAALRGVEVREPWGALPPVGEGGGELAGAVAVRMTPPALVVLPAPLAELAAPAWRGTILGEQSRALSTAELALPHVDVGGAAGRGRGARLATTVEGSGDLVVRLHVRGGEASLTLDGRPVGAASPLPLTPGAHLLEATLERRRVAATLELDVEARGGARCCALPPAAPPLPAAPPPPAAPGATP